jgi:Domain of unknown function (DUF4190)
MISNKCRQCGLVNFTDATVCRRCNTSLAWEAETAVAAVSSGQPDAYDYAAAVNLPREPVEAYSAEGSLPSPGYVSPYGNRSKLRTGQATASLVLGVLGLFSAGLLVVGSLIGLVLGIRAALKARREPNVYGAKGVAIGGIVMNSLGILSIIPIAIMASLVISGIAQAAIAANEASAIEHMYQISGAEAMFQSTVGGGESFGNMDELIEEGLIPADSASKHGYRFTIRLVERESPTNTSFQGFEVVGVPQSYGWTGKMSFYGSEQGEVRYADRRGAEAKSIDEPVGEYYDQLRNPFAKRRSTSRSLMDD